LGFIAFSKWKEDLVVDGLYKVILSRWLFSSSQKPILWLKDIRKLMKWIIKRLALQLLKWHLCVLWSLWQL